MVIVLACFSLFVYGFDSVFHCDVYCVGLRSLLVLFVHWFCYCVDLLFQWFGYCVGWAVNCFVYGVGLAFHGGVYWSSIFSLVSLSFHWFPIVFALVLVFSS